MSRRTSFYYSFLVLPAAKRNAMLAIWDFCRAVDDAVDEVESVTPDMPTGREATRFWRTELGRCYDGTPPLTPQGRRLQPVVTAFNLPRNAFEDVIDGVAMDLDTTRYETFPELVDYCRRVASAVGMLCIRVFGCDSEAAHEYAFNLGVALQLTNILRDIKDDLARNRLYLPTRDLDACGCAIDELRAGRTSDQVRRLVRFECDRAREFYARAERALPPGDRRRLVAAEIMRHVYFETLRRIERGGYDVFAASVRVRRPAQALIALKTWIGAQRRTS